LWTIKELFSKKKDPGLFQGDIMGTTYDTAKGLLTTAYNKWTNGIVYYVIDNNAFCKFTIFNNLSSSPIRMYFHFIFTKSHIRIANNLYGHENN
jgi:hypothetical protein